MSLNPDLWRKRMSIPEVLNEVQRIDRNRSLWREGISPTDTFLLDGTAIHDPECDESGRASVDPFSYYGLTYVAWRDRVVYHWKYAEYLNEIHAAGTMNVLKHGVKYLSLRFFLTLEDATDVLKWWMLHLKKDQG